MLLLKFAPVDRTATHVALAAYGDGVFPLAEVSERYPVAGKSSIDIPVDQVPRG